MFNFVVTAIYFGYVYYSMSNEGAPHWALMLLCALGWAALDIARVRDKQ